MKLLRSVGGCRPSLRSLALRPAKPLQLIGAVRPWDQLTACFTSATIRFSSAAVSFVSANSVGHIWPSSSFALSLNPSVAYLDLNLSAHLKKQTTLSSFAYAGIPYQVLGESSG